MNLNEITNFRLETEGKAIKVKSCDRNIAISYENSCILYRIRSNNSLEKNGIFKTNGEISCFAYSSNVGLCLYSRAMKEMTFYRFSKEKNVVSIKPFKVPNLMLNKDIIECAL